MKKQTPHKVLKQKYYDEEFFDSLSSGEEMFIDGGVPQELNPKPIFPTRDENIWSFTITNPSNAPQTVTLFNAETNLTATNNGLPDFWTMVYLYGNYTYPQMLSSLQEQPIRVGRIRIDCASTDQLENGSPTIVRNSPNGNGDSLPMSHTFSIFQSSQTGIEWLCNEIMDGKFGLQYTFLPNTSVTFFIYPTAEQPILKYVDGCWVMVDLYD